MVYEILGGSHSDGVQKVIKDPAIICIFGQVEVEPLLYRFCGEELHVDF